jgi:hypothetical protein
LRIPWLGLWWRDVMAELRRVIGAIAATSGTLLRHTVTKGPGVLGAVLVTYGLGQIYQPLLFLSAGIWLLLIDRRIPS